ELIYLIDEFGMRNLMFHIRSLNQDGSVENPVLIRLISQLNRSPFFSDLQYDSEGLISFLVKLRGEHEIRLNRAGAESRSIFLQPANTSEVLKEGVSIQYIEDIARDDRWFTTPGINRPCRLSEAIMDQFYQFVVEQGWGEALDLIGLSQQGPYII